MCLLLKKILFCLGVLVLVLHFSLLIIYAFPFRSPGTAPPYKAQWYMYPFFHQGWNLFVPPPRNNYKLLVSCGEGKVVDLMAAIRNEHRSNPLKGYGGLLNAFSNSIYQFEQNTELGAVLNGPVSHDPNFRILEYSARAYLRWDHGCSTEKMRMILLVNSPSGSRVYFN